MPELSDSKETNFISAVLITKNEEKNIEACLLSLKPLADEIVVADSGSTDRTREICLAHGVKFFPVGWEGYARTKNKANALASYNWILSIDADEVISPELLQSILALKNTPNLPQRHYRMKRLTNYCGHWVRHGGWYPDIKYRLFDRRQARWQGDYVHETLEHDPGIDPQLLKGDLLHYTFHTIDEHAAQVNRYSTLAAEDKHRRGKKSSLAKLLISPWWTFVQMYFLKAGFRDGRYGLIIAVISAYARFLRYAKLYQMGKGK